MPAVSNRIPTTIPITAEVSTTFPARKMEVGPSAPPITDTDLATDVCPFTLKTRLIAAVTIPITAKIIPTIFFMH